MKSKFVFLDRDNTLIKDNGYIYKIKDLKWKSGAKKGLLQLAKLGFKFIVITNQSGIARGYFSEMDVHMFHQYMNDDLIKTIGVRIEKFYYSPFHPDGIIPKYKKHSECRKPGTALFKRAIKENDILLSQSIVIGDKQTDLIPAINCGVNNAYLLNCESDEKKLHTLIKVVNSWKDLRIKLIELYNL